MTVKKILVADDDPGVLAAIQTILAEEGYIVEGTNKTAKIFEKVIKFMPDVLILDVLLGRQDGRDVAWQIKSYEKTKKIPIIVISAHPAAEQTAKESGANEFISKPFKITTLINKIKKLTP